MGGMSLRIRLANGLVIAALLFSLFEGTLLGKNSSGLHGKVIYQMDRQPIRNAYVLVHRNGVTDTHVLTDEHGKYSVELPAVFTMCSFQRRHLPPRVEKLRLNRTA